MPRQPLASALALAAVLAGVLAAGGYAQTTVTPDEGPLQARPAAASATLTLDSATVNASWKESWLIGNVAFEGTVSAVADLSAFLRRTDPKPTAVAARTTLTAGPGAYAGTFPLPHRSLPGTYLVHVGGTSEGGPLTAVETMVTIPAPPEGIVDKSVISRTPGGPSVRRVRGSVRQLYARFHFLVPPETRSVRILWRTPQFNFVGEVRKPYRENVESFIKSGRPLAKGTWYCILQVNESVTKRIAVRVG